MNKIAEQFAKMGARAKIRLGSELKLDVLTDKDGEYFDIQTRDAEVSVLNVDKPGRHLLLQTRQNNDGVSLAATVRKGGESFNTQKFLCGHDERHWFVATVNPSAGTVAKAKAALKPRVVRDQEGKVGVAKGKRNRRHNKASQRQGEWFFMPQGSFKPPEKAIILKNEPFTRGGGSKNHYAEFCYRSGGESVWVSSEYPNGIDEKTYSNLMKNNPAAKKYHFRNMRRGAAMYVKGKISHADHKTLVLKEWCLVVMNNESRSSQVAFLD
jgi:hypothetical protein